jgi:hypothetical protein
MSEEMWITFREAVPLVRDRIGASVGRAEALVREARKSGEVRPAPGNPLNYLGGDDGLDMEITARKQAILEAQKFSQDDLLDWLTRHAAPAVPEDAGEPSEGAKTRRALKALRALWGDAGPPEHMALKLICSEVRRYLKEQEGAEPDMTDKTIQNALKKIRS